MYFWRIEDLKKQMATRPLSEREVLPYLVVFSATMSAIWLIPADPRNLWDYLSMGFSVLLSIVGTIWLYRRNGGASGQHFLQRYFAIGWVVGIRWVVVFILVGIPFYGFVTAFGPGLEVTTWYESAFFAVAELALYWRFGVHIGDIAARTSAGFITAPAVHESR
jgi:hypothetical protein